MTNSSSLTDQVKSEIESLSASIGALVDSMQKLRHPISESHQKMPQATNQLDKISQQTLAATQRMLDTVEEINKREDMILESIKYLVSLLPVNSSAEVKEQIRIIQVAAQENLDAAYALMDALQFQDITSQQVDHAASMLEDIEGKLAHILQVVGIEDKAIHETTTQMPTKQRAFDPNADLFEKKTQQADIDELFVKKK